MSPDAGLCWLECPTLLRFARPVAGRLRVPFGINPTWTPSPQGTGGVNNDIALGPDNLFIHMTGMSDLAWQGVRRRRTGLDLVPDRDEHGHGIPPILKMQSLGIEPSLSSDVEITMTGDFVGEIE